VVTELGMSTDVRLLQSSNAHIPIVVTELGIVMEVRLLHS
jgi:metal-sulfur cluster biosynthetic enzyme